MKASGWSFTAIAGVITGFIMFGGGVKDEATQQLATAVMMAAICITATINMAVEQLLRSKK